MPLHIAAYNGSVEIVKRLLLAGAPIHVTNGNSRTPASLAAQEGGGRPADKEQCLALINGWQTAVPGSPVLVGTVVTEQSDFYYFGRGLDDAVEPRPEARAEGAPVPEALAGAPHVV